jgi:hypothetical protein
MEAGHHLVDKYPRGDNVRCACGAPAVSESPYGGPPYHCGVTGPPIEWPPRPKLTPERKRELQSKKEREEELLVLLVAAFFNDCVPPGGGRPPDAFIPNG